MKRIGIYAFTVVFFPLFFITICSAEMAREGSGAYRGTKSSSNEILAMEKERLQMNFSELGMVVEAPENSPFVNATFIVIGTLHAIKGQFEGSGFVEWTCPNEDKIYATIVTKGTLGRASSTVGQIIGGTGGCTGIQGSLEVQGGPPVKSARKDTWQGSTIGKVSWKLP